MSALSFLAATSSSFIQTSPTTTDQEITGCWEIVKNLAMSFFNRISNMTTENQFGLIVVVILFTTGLGINIHEFLSAFQRK